MKWFALRRAPEEESAPLPSLGDRYDPAHICGPRCIPAPYTGSVVLGRRCVICLGPDGPECGRCHDWAIGARTEPPS